MRVHHHPCLYSTIAITADKKMILYPALDDEVLLDLSTNDKINAAFEERQISKYWDLALSKVEYCKEYEFKYGCIDCRGIEKKINFRIYTEKNYVRIKEENEMDWMVQIVAIAIILIILYSRHKKGEKVLKNVLPMILTMAVVFLILVLISLLMK
jgi:hypothetical protein